MMNQGNISSNHLALSGNSSSSKTVAAILKQANDHQNPSEAARSQQSQVLKKKSRPGSDQPSSIMSQHMSKGSPQNSVASPSVVGSPTMSPSSNRGISPLGKEHNHPVTTKSSSLSRDLSPSLITAQIVKVMAETTTTAATPNLLRSALQGNMPDPMGILSSSKTEGGYVTVVAPPPGSIQDYTPSNRKSPANMSSLSPNSNSISGPHHQGHTFSKIRTSIAGAGGYLGQPEVDPIDSLMTTSTVENLLASSDGVIQTVNVSHIPKSMNPNSTTIGTLSGSSSTAPCTSRSSQRMAMEVAQQIKMEANGQKSSAQLAALRPGMQQQLRSQIQSSRSIDAQFTPKPVPFTGQPSSHRASPKEIEHKTLEATMPLLASKLTPTAASSNVTKLATSSIASHLKLHPSPQQQQMTSCDSSAFLSSASLVSASPSVSLTSTSTSMSRKSVQIVNQMKPTGESQQQQNIIRHIQQPPEGNFSQSKQLQPEPGLSSDFWTHQHIQLQQQSDPQASTLGSNDHHTRADNQQTLERLIFQGNMSSAVTERTAQTDMPPKVESHSQTIAKQLSSQHGYQRSSLPSQMSSVQAMLSKIGQNLPSKTTSVVGGGRNIQTHHDVQMHHDVNSVPTSHTAKPVSKFRPGESKQTAIDVDLDIGQLASITGDGASIRTNSSTDSTYTTAKDIKHSGLQSAQDHQLCSTAISDSSTSTAEQTAAKSRDPQIFLPVQAFKSSPSFTLHSLTSSATSSLAHIPKPIVHTSSTSSSISTSAAATTLPPPPDYIPPPPYPSKVSQYQPTQQKQQSQFISNRVGQAAKQSAHNPFTFPTSGVKVHADSSSHGLSFSYASSNSGVLDEPEDVKQNLYGNFKEELGTLNKSHSDISVTSHRRMETGIGYQSDMPRLLPEMSSVKVEVNEDHHNHVDEVNGDDKRPVMQPFNQRVSNLSCFPVMNSSYRAAYRSHAVAVQRARSGVITNTAKSLDILRQNLQRKINKEITEIIKRYTDKYFQPALENIKQNNSENFLGDEHINYVCRQILEEAKAEYMSDSGRRSVTPSDIPDNVSETGSLGKRMIFKRSRISDSDSEKGSDGGFKKKKKGRPLFQGSGRITPSKTYKAGEPVKREGPKWDPERLKPDTLFVMGARANKALGLGNTRGRLYIRHPDVFKYIGDQDDKLWLCEHNLMPATGGKAYMLLLEDIEDLSRSDEYRESPGLMMHECVGFTVPEWMLVKIKEQMNALRSDSSKRSLSRSPASEFGELSRPKILPFSAFTDSSVKEQTMVSPADTEEMDFLSTADTDDRQPTSTISSFIVTSGFEDAVSPSPSELDPIEDPPTVPSLFS